MKAVNMELVEAYRMMREGEPFSCLLVGGCWYRATLNGFKLILNEEKLKELEADYEKLLGAANE